MCDHKPFGQLSDAEKGALLLAHHGGKLIELLLNSGGWALATPTWNTSLVYRIAPKTLIPDSIDWSHVAPDVVAIARNKFGEVLCYKEIPAAQETGDWYGAFCAAATVFASYRRGTVDWKDSLVRRPS